MPVKKLSSFILRRKVPTFAIVSLARSGSTALYRALSCSSRVRIAYEPEFGIEWNDRGTLDRTCRYLVRRCSGFKHVWDPNGSPFSNSHVSTLENLALSQKWMKVNSDLLTSTLSSPKVVLLRRRNLLARTVSDLLGQQTHLWGHDPSAAHSAQESRHYRDQMLQQQLAPMDLKVIDWYLSYSRPWEDQIAAAIPNSRKRTVYYEDLFGPDVDIETRMLRVAELGEWLEIPIKHDDAQIRAILQPESKFNSGAIYSRIPNYREIVSAFGEIENAAPLTIAAPGQQAVIAVQQQSGLQRPQSIATIPAGRRHR